MTLLSQEEVLIEKMLKFYSNPSCLSIFIGIVEQRTVISLRLLDWFSTNYSKFNRIYIDKIDIHSDYKNKLDGYKKKCFDPFCRKQRIFVYAKDTKCIRKNLPENLNLSYKYIENYEEYLSDPSGIVTTVGQLNFFMWCMERNILDYIIKNFKIIEQSMSDTYKLKTLSKKNEKLKNPLEKIPIDRKKYSSVAHKTFMKFTISF